MSFAHSLIGFCWWCVLFLQLSCMSFLLWILTPYQMYDLEIFSPIPIGCLFILLILSFDMQIILVFMQSNLSSYSFVAFAFGIISRKSLPNVLKLFPIFPSIGLNFGHKFRSLIRFELSLQMVQNAHTFTFLIMLHCTKINQSNYISILCSEIHKFKTIMEKLNLSLNLGLQMK